MLNNSSSSSNVFHGTTILCLKYKNEVVMIADGQVTLGSTVIKATAKKLRTLNNGKIMVGFAGSTADALTLFERLEAKLEKYTYQLLRASVELAKDWRTDKYLRKLEAMLLVADKENILIITGNGDVVEPEFDVAAIGSGGAFALSAARAFLSTPNQSMSAEEIAKASMKIAADQCIYSNNNITVNKII